MQKLPTGEMEIQLRRPTDAGGNSLPPTRLARRSLSSYTLLLAPGLLTGLFAVIVYPLLDAGPWVAFGLCLLLLPMLLQLRSILRNRLNDDLHRLRADYAYAGLVLAVLAAFVLKRTSNLEGCCNDRLNRHRLSGVTTDCSFFRPSRIAANTPWDYGWLS